jgi:hypothetical protein
LFPFDKVKKALSDGSRKAGEDMKKARESIVERAEKSITHINETNESVQ